MNDDDNDIIYFSQNLDENQFKKCSRTFNKEFEKKIGFDPEKEELIGIRLEDIGKVSDLDLKLNKRYKLLEDLSTYIEIFEKKITELNERWEETHKKPSEIKDLEDLILHDKNEVEKLEKSLKKAQNYALEEDDLLGISFLNPSDEERELKTLTKLVKKSAKYLSKLRKLKRFLLLS